jgi:hypothetical protein
MRHPGWILMLVPALSVANCARASAQGSGSVTPCTVSGVALIDSTWRQVRASGFTFCVPGSWRPQGHGQDTLDAKQWAGDEGFVEWDTGAPPPTPMPNQQYIITGTVIQSGGLPSVPPPSPRPAPVPIGPTECPQSRTTPRLVGQVVLFTTQANCEGTWTTTVWSFQPRIYLRARARYEKAATLLVAVAETVNVTNPGH